MEYMKISFEVVFPIFVFMAVGYSIKKSGMVDSNTFSMMNRMVFQIFLPLKLFLEIYESDFESAFQLDLVCYIIIGLIVSFIVLCFIVPKFEKDTRNISVIIQGLHRSNFVLFGMSVAANIYSDQDLGVVSIVAAFVVPLFNILAVVVFEIFRGNKLNLKTIIIGVVKNNFVVAGFFGILFALTKTRIPNLFSNPLNSMGAMSTPLAIICLGASFSLGALKKYWNYLVVCSLGRLVFIPGIFVTLAVFLGFRNIELSTILLVFGTPTATASYVMAKEFGGNEELAGMIVAATSILSILSMFLWIFTLKYNKLI